MPVSASSQLESSERKCRRPLISQEIIVTLITKVHDAGEWKRNNLLRQTKTVPKEGSDNDVTQTERYDRVSIVS